MAGRAPDPGFFVGYLNTVPRPLAIFLVVAAALLVGGMAGLAFAIGTNVNDPGDGAFARKLGKQAMSGVLLENPYPILRVRPDANNPEPRTIMLTVPGKRSVKRRGRKLFDQVVDVSGFLFQRGDIDMLQVQGRNSLIAAEAGEGEPPPTFTPGAGRIPRPLAPHRRDLRQQMPSGRHAPGRRACAQGLRQSLHFLRRPADLRHGGGRRGRGRDVSADGQSGRRAAPR